MTAGQLLRERGRVIKRKRESIRCYSYYTYTHCISIQLLLIFLHYYFFVFTLWVEGQLYCQWDRLRVCVCVYVCNDYIGIMG